MFKRYLLQDNALLYAISSRTPKVSQLSVQRYIPALLHTVNYSTSADAELYWKLPLILNNRFPTLYLSNIVRQKPSIQTKPSKDFQQDSFFFFLSNLKKVEEILKRSPSRLAWLLIMNQTISLLLPLLPAPSLPKSKEVVCLKYSYLKQAIVSFPPQRPPRFSILKLLCTRQIKLAPQLSAACKDLLLCNVFITIYQHLCINRAYCAR